MDADYYQDRSKTTAIFPKWADTLYPILGLCGEVSELVAKFYDQMWPYGVPIPDNQEQFQQALLTVIGFGKKC